MADPPPIAKPDIYVLARFFDALSRPEAAFTKRKLQAAVRLNYDLFRSYLLFLESRGLVVVREVERGSDAVALTSAGREASRQLLDWIQRTLGGSVI